MPVQIKISDHILMPFGCPKWEKDQIQMASVGLDGTYFVSNTKCAYINKAQKKPLLMTDFKSYFPNAESSFPEVEDDLEAFDYAFKIIETSCEIDTVHERKFLQLYKENIVSGLKDILDWQVYSKKFTQEQAHNLYYKLFAALMPFPQAHLYARDPFIPASVYAFAPDRMFKVDFAFWTGEQFVAVEVDGGSHIGSEKHIAKDRLLARSGVHVIHILNSEIDTYGIDVIRKLLPPEIRTPKYFDKETPILNPFNGIPF